MAVRQVVAEFGDGGVVVGQLLPDGQSLAVLGLRLRGSARSQSTPEVLLAVRQVVAEVGDGGVVVGQLLLDASALRNSASASPVCPVSDSGDAVDVNARSARARVARGGPAAAPVGAGW